MSSHPLITHTPRRPAIVADEFIARWSRTESAERTNAAPFLIDLCDLLALPRPEPATGNRGAYRFERGVTHRDNERETTRRIDLYKRGCFILEAKQGANPVPLPAEPALPKASPAEPALPKASPEFFALSAETTRRQAVRASPAWHQHMTRALGQAKGYVGDLPPEEPAPPFIIVCDVGFCFDVYADFSGTGRHYSHFPDRNGFRLYLDDLRDSAIRDRLAAIWTDPLSLDPARRRTEVTREIAQFLAHLARALETRHAPNTVATFLMRCLFSMFAQSVGLLPQPDTFGTLLDRCRQHPEKFPILVGDLWRAMNTGGISVAADAATIRKFNGGLFAPHAGGAGSSNGFDGSEPLRLTADEIGLLASAARRDWRNVEPAIFGTLLENALTPAARGQLGAHFTPRAFVERLVLPTVMDPLRRRWDGVQAAAFASLQTGDRIAAAAAYRTFHADLCNLTILDPACGTGNFLYVTMELIKRLEGEVLDALATLIPGEGDRLALQGASVDPHQFRGLEKNPRAVPVAELVLWIGYLQWHFRTHGAAPPAEPILRDFRTIQHADALLLTDGDELLRDKSGRPLTRWDGRTTKPHPLTGEPIPDEAFQVERTRPINPRLATWPEADFIVGNPPFIAGQHIRQELGDAYASALWNAYSDVPSSADLAMFFWWKAAQQLLVNKHRLQRFGFITSNSIRQIFCRRVISAAMATKRRLRLIFAIPDHPWSDGAGSAAVRIAMTVAERDDRQLATPSLQRVIAERANSDGIPAVELERVEGAINADLSVGADPNHAFALQANERITSPGIKLHGTGFVITLAQAISLGIKQTSGIDNHIRHYVNGRDVVQHSRDKMVIDLFGLSEAQVRSKYPDSYQHVLLRVKPERDQKSRASYRENWWIFGEPRRELRPALVDLPRYIVTVIVAKHRIFQFLDGNILADDTLLCVAINDASVLGVLSSRIHKEWSLRAGGWMGVGNDPRYNKTRCLDPFPFPNATPTQRATIAALAKELDALRRTRLDAHPHLTMTALYNVLEALRADRPLTPTERDIHDAGQISILRRLHDDLDQAVAAAYAWPADLPAPEIVARIVALNIARRAEEALGTVRWLRPAYQAPAEPVRLAQPTLGIIETADTTLPTWPLTEADRYVALRSLLATTPGHPADLGRRFKRAPTAKIRAMLETLTVLGQANRDSDGRYRM